MVGSGSQGTGRKTVFLEPKLHTNKLSKDFQGCFRGPEMEKMFVFHITYVPTFKNVFLILLFHGEIEALVQSVGGSESPPKPPPGLLPARPCVRNEEWHPTLSPLPLLSGLTCGRESPCK